jgi:hypothetical protein
MIATSHHSPIRAVGRTEALYALAALLSVALVFGS